MAVRKLNLKDVFKFSRLVKKTGAKEDMLAAFKEISSDGEMAQTELGIHYAFIFLEIFSKDGCEEDLYDLLSGPLDCSKSDVPNMELTELAEKLFEVASVDEWKAFFKKAVPSIPSKSESCLPENIISAM